MKKNIKIPERVLAIQFPNLEGRLRVGYSYGTSPHFEQKIEFYRR